MSFRGKIFLTYNDHSSVVENIVNLVCLICQVHTLLMRKHVLNSSIYDSN